MALVGTKPLEFGKLFSDLGTLKTAIAACQSEVPVRKMTIVIPVLTVGSQGVTAANEEDVRHRIYLGLCKADQAEGAMSTVMASWFLTLLVTLFPPFLVMLSRQPVAYRITTVPFPDAVVTAAMNDPATQIQFTAGLFLNWDMTIPSDDSFRGWEVGAHFGILIYFFGKSVEDRSFNKAVANRVRALSGVAASTPLPGGPLDTMLPDKDMVMAMQSALAAVPEVRPIIVTEVVSWMGSHRSVTETMVAVTARLWVNAGLKHVETIKMLLAAHHETVMSIPTLATEATLFVQQFEQALNSQNAMFPFIKVMRPREDTLSSKNFPELFRLALQLERARDSRMNQYAATVAKSPYYDVFADRVEASGGAIARGAIAGGQVI